MFIFMTVDIKCKIAFAEILYYQVRRNRNYTVFIHDIPFNGTMCCVFLSVSHYLNINEQEQGRSTDRLILSLLHI